MDDRPKLSVAIMAHPRREHLVADLERQLPGGRVVWDRHNDRWATGAQSMLAFDPAADWHLVVQDDAILCRDFLPGVAAALEHAHHGPVSFYTGRGKPLSTLVEMEVRRVRAAGKHWLSAKGPQWGVAIAIPTPLIESMVAACDRASEPNYDLRIADYFEAQGIPCWYSLPSLVNHRVGRDNPSLVPGRSSAESRVAHEWIGARSPLDVDWSTGAVAATGSGLAMLRRLIRRPTKGTQMRYATRDIFALVGEGDNAVRRLIARKGQRIPPEYLSVVSPEETTDHPGGLPATAAESESGDGQSADGDDGADRDYRNAWKVGDLRAELDRRKIEYPKSAPKDALAELLERDDASVATE